MNKYFGSAVKATLPQEQPWIFQYFNWWSRGEIVTYEGTEKQCLKEQYAVENAAWTEYCNGYGPGEKLTVYIGPKYQAVCEFSHGDGSIETFEGTKMSMTAVEILNGFESVKVADGWYLANRGSYIVLATNIGCPYQDTDKKLKPDTPYEVIQYYMGGLREVCREIPNHGYQYDWDLYKISHTDVPVVENPEKWLYVEPKRISPPLLKAREGFYAHKEF